MTPPKVQLVFAGNNQYIAATSNQIEPTTIKTAPRAATPFFFLKNQNLLFFSEASISRDSAKNSYNLEKQNQIQKSPTI